MWQKKTAPKKKIDNKDKVDRKKKIRIFHSFAEAKQADLEETLKMDPIERVRQTVELIIRAYGFTREELLTRKPSSKITILRSK